jgi:hypothetical protein
MFIRNL